MIVFLIICQIFFNNIHGFFLDWSYYQEFGERCTRGVASKLYPVNSSRLPTGNFSPRSNRSLYIEKSDKNDITRLKRGPPGNVVKAPYSCRTERHPKKINENLDKCSGVKVVPNDTDTQLPRSETGSESCNKQGDASIFSRPGTSTAVQPLRDVESPPVTHSVIYSFSNDKKFHHATRKTTQEEVTLLPIRCVSQVVDLVFPLEGKPPSQYSCFEIKTDNDTRSAKVIKIYKLIKPHQYDMIYKEVDSNNTNNPNVNITKIITTKPKRKRHAYWLELQSPLVTLPYNHSKLPFNKPPSILSIFKPKLDRSKSKRLKNKKTSRQPGTNGTTTSMHRQLLQTTTELQTEPLPPELDPLLSNETQTFGTTIFDSDKIFIKSRENSTEGHDSIKGTITEYPDPFISHMPTDTPIKDTSTEASQNRGSEKTFTKDSTDQSEASSISDRGKENTKPQLNDKDKAGKLAPQDKSYQLKPAKEKGPNKDPLTKTSTTTTNPTNLSTKFIYGHELHVRYDSTEPYF